MKTGQKEKKEIFLKKNLEYPKKLINFALAKREERPPESF